MKQSPTGQSPVQVRPMTRPELDVAVDWAAAEGWNPGLYDADLFWATDPGGFLLAQQDGRMVGCISAVAYGEDFGFVGFYIVRPDRRGQGIGLRLWRQALARLQGRVVGLDGVVAQQANYAKSGFVLAFNNTRYQGQGGGQAPAGVVALEQVPWPAIAALDGSCFPAPREEFLRRWVSHPGFTTAGIMQGQELAGLGVLRPCRQGAKIGPLFAREPQSARDIFLALEAAAPGQPIFLDVPGNNPLALELAREQGLEPVFATARMYLGPAPVWESSWVYGITSFELG